MPKNSSQPEHAISEHFDVPSTDVEAMLSVNRILQSEAITAELEKEYDPNLVASVGKIARSQVMHGQDVAQVREKADGTDKDDIGLFYDPVESEVVRDALAVAIHSRYKREALNVLSKYAPTDAERETAEAMLQADLRAHPYIQPIVPRAEL